MSESLVDYACRQMGFSEYPDHLKKVAACLEQVESGQIKRLIVQMPPRSGKTCLLSEAFPAWYLERNPNDSVFAVFYSEPLAAHIGKKVASQTEGRYKSMGVGTAISGVRANLVVIDDPTANREQSSSMSYQNRVRNWYTSFLLPHLFDDAAIVVVQTGWGQHDLSNWLLQEYKDDDWAVLKIPSINEQGESYWPQQYSVKRLRELEKVMGTRYWNALYQQDFGMNPLDYHQALKNLHQLEEVVKASVCPLCGTNDFH